jgi:hypothetical protein
MRLAEGVHASIDGVVEELALRGQDGRAVISRIV